MKGLAAAFTGAVGGLGQGVADVGNKYLDDQILQNRAQVLADIQRKSAVQQAQDIDAYQNDPKRREAMRIESGKDASAANSVALEGRIAEATSPQLQEARRANLKAEAAIPGQAAAEQLIANGGDRKYIGALRAITSAQHFTGPGEELARFQLQQQKQIAEIRGKLANEQDPAKREELQRQEAALTGNTRSDKDLSIALAQTVTAMERANKVLADPMADAEAKDSARESIAALKASATHLSRKLGIDPKQTQGQPKQEAGTPWARFQTPGGQPQASGQTSPSQQPEAAPAPLVTTSTGPSSSNLMDQRRGLQDPSWNGARERLEPLAQQYMTAKEQLRRAAQSGDPRALDAWKGPVAQLQAKLRSEAERNLGMYADEFLKSVEVR